VQGRGERGPVIENELSLQQGLVEVRALDDAEALKAAEPRWLGGEPFDPQTVRARGTGDGEAAGGRVRITVEAFRKAASGR
jgi:hypothetical protein